MSTRTAEFDAALESDYTVTITCDCGYAHTCSTQQFKAYRTNQAGPTVIKDGEWGWALATDNFQIECPDCNSKNGAAKLSSTQKNIAIKIDSANNPGKTLADASTEKRHTVFTEITNSKNYRICIDCGCETKTIYDSKEKLKQEADADSIKFEPVDEAFPISLAQNSFTFFCADCHRINGEAVLREDESQDIIEIIPTESDGCPNCTYPIIQNGFTTGPEAPEIGWEYYQCPECGETQRPESVTPEI